MGGTGIGNGIGIRRGRSRGSHHNATGMGTLRKQGEPGLLPNHLHGGSRVCTPRRTDHTPVKMAVDNEVSKDCVNRHTSPGIVGKLMGLDTMPSFVVPNKSTCSGNLSENMLPGSCSDKCALSEDVPCKRSTDEIPEFKDVFEVMETTRTMNRSPKSGNNKIRSKSDKVNSADLNLVRRKFVDAEHLSTDGSFRRSKEFNDALEALVSNKDLLLEWLEESNDVCSNDLPDLSSLYSGVNCITILKPSIRNKFIDPDVVCSQKEDTGRPFHTAEEENQRKPYINFSSQPTKGDGGSFRQKMTGSSNGESIDNRTFPARIVVLKPFLEKTQNMEGALPLTHEMFRSSHRTAKACLNNGIQSQMPTEDSNMLGHRAIESKEIAREVTDQMRRAVKGRVSGKRILNPDIVAFNWDEQASLQTSMTKIKSSEAFQRFSRTHDASAPCLGSSPTYSTKTSIRKEGRRRLSDRWKITNQRQHPSQDAKTFSTLGGILSLSDKESPTSTSGSTACGKCPKGELHRDGMPGLCGYPLGISSNDGWKDENVSNLTGPKPICSSSISRGSSKLCSRKGGRKPNEFSLLEDIVGVGPYNSEDVQQGRSWRLLTKSLTDHCDEIKVWSLDEVESVVIEREMHLNFEAPSYNVDVPESSEAGGRFVHRAKCNLKVGAECHLDTGSVVPECQDNTLASVAARNKVMGSELGLVLDDHIIIPSLTDCATKVEGSSHHQHEEDQARANPLAELVSNVSSDEDDQPSPVSVLESSLDTEEGYSGGFGKISADLQELRMQLRLLKMDATENADETGIVLLSDDETAGSYETGVASYIFWDEDERDFSYVQEMLTCLGIRSGEQDLLPEFPGGNDVYDILEKKYSKLILWPTCERRLLFDLTNDVLVDIIACLTHCGRQELLHKCKLLWDNEGHVEEVWEKVCQHRREAECFREEKLMGVGWLDCEDVTNEIAREMVSMLDEDLLEEAIAELLV